MGRKSKEEGIYVYVPLFLLGKFHGQGNLAAYNPWGHKESNTTGSGLPCPAPGDLPNSGIKPRSPALQSDSLLSESPEKPREESADTFMNLYPGLQIYISSYLGEEQIIFLLSASS